MCVKIKKNNAIKAYKTPDNLVWDGNVRNTHTPEMNSFIVFIAFVMFLCDVTSIKSFISCIPDTIGI